MNFLNLNASDVASRRAFAALLSACLLVGAGPAQAGASSADLDTGVQLIQRASGGDASAIEPADAHFARLMAADPADPVVRAYAGAAHAMRATTTLLPWRKMGFAEDGLALLDKALAQLTPAHDKPAGHGVPVSLEVKFTAANTFLALPGMFNRRDRGTRLLDEVLRSPLLGGSAASFQSVVRMAGAKQAQAASRNDEARALYQQVAQSATPQASAAQAALKALP